MKDPDASHIALGLSQTRQRVARACERAGRSPSEVRLVAVSKTHSAEHLRTAYAAGQRLFGENYVQELVDKAQSLSDLEELRFRFIGHLQRNKVKDIVRAGATVDTVDSERLVRALARGAERAGQRLEVLLQVNVAGEAQKSGCAPAEVSELVRQVHAEEALDLRGLMTIAPYAADPETARPVFRRLRELADEHGLPERSMGMSQDLEVAVEEGATMVRVGTAIFGVRG
jgi:hypothetical protein